MGCNCGRKQDKALAGTTLRASTSIASSSGIYDTTSAPGCTEPYTGAFRSAYIYAVDINGPREQFFVRSERDKAVRLARTERLRLDQVAATNLCNDLMIALLGA